MVSRDGWPVTTCSCKGYLKRPAICCYLLGVFTQFSTVFHFFKYKLYPLSRWVSPPLPLGFKLESKIKYFYDFARVSSYFLKMFWLALITITFSLFFFYHVYKQNFFARLAGAYITSSSFSPFLGNLLATSVCTMYVHDKNMTLF